MSDKNEFRAKAAACIRRAAQLQNGQYQRLYYNLAIEWLALAAEADARVAKPASPTLAFKAAKSSRHRPRSSSRSKPASRRPHAA